MCRLFETIRVVDRQVFHLSYHERRIQASRLALFELKERISLSEMIDTNELPDGEFKCKVVYGREVEEILFEPYSIRSIQRVAMVDGNHLSYPFKFSDREQFEKVRLLFPGYDELIFVMNGYLTDSTFSNLAFHDGQQWFSPNSPLLMGTCLSRLLETGSITSRAITPGDITSFTSLSFINAMLEPGKILISTNQIEDFLVYR